jgi:signal peptidase II
MTPLQTLFQKPTRHVLFIASAVIALDQLTKHLVVRLLPFETREKVIIEGFFKFVHWGNTGAAWSLFRGSNYMLALIAFIAVVALWLTRRHFEAHSVLGQSALGLIVGGIIGNFIDRIWSKHVIDFLYFYLQQRGGTEIGFPAFNVADSAICTGVGLIFLLTWRSEHPAAPVASGARPASKEGA